MAGNVGRLLGMVGFVALSLSLASRSDAAIVTWTFTGQVDQISATRASSLAAMGVTSGTAFSTSLVFDNSTPAASTVSPPTNYCCGDYQNAVLAWNFHAGTYDPILQPGSVGDMFAPYHYAYFTADASNPAPLSLESPRFYLEIVGTLNLNGLKLPTAPPIPPSGGTPAIVYIFDENGQTLRAPVYQFTYTVPEPSGVLALAALLLLMAARGVRLAA